MNSYLDFKFEVIKKTDITRYGNGIDVMLINVGPIAFFSSFKKTTSSGEHPEDNSQAHIVSLMYKLLTNAKDSSDLCVGFHQDRERS